MLGVSLHGRVQTVGVSDREPPGSVSVHSVGHRLARMWETHDTWITVQLGWVRKTRRSQL